MNFNSVNYFPDSWFDLNDTVVKFKPTDDENSLIAKDVAVVSNGDTNIYIGTNQVSSNNQDPIIASFTNGVRDWVTTNIETTGADSRGVALLWDGDNNLYAAFTTDGTQGSVEQDFRRFTTEGWLSSYGRGGGAKATVLLEIDPDNGSGIIGRGTFVSSLLSNGNTNTLVPTNLSFDGDGIVLEANTYFSPRRVDTTRMIQTADGGSPFEYTITFDNTLQVAQSSIAIGWDGVTQPDAEPIQPDPETIQPNPETVQLVAEPIEPDSEAVQPDPETVQPSLELITVNRFYQHQKGFHFYSVNPDEVSMVRQEIAAGNLDYNYEGEAFSALSSNLDSLTGKEIEGAKPVFYFFNRDTEAHLFTMELRERDYILDNLNNYSFEGTAYYAFAEEPEAIDTIPIYRMLNNQTGSHLFTSDCTEFDYLKENLSHFSVEADNGIAFHVLDM